MTLIRLRTLLVIAMMFALSAVTHAQEPQTQAPTLFVAASPPAVRVPEPIPSFRTRFVELQIALLADSVLGSRVTLSLFPGVTLVGAFERAEYRTATNFTWFGSVEGDLEASITIVVNGTVAMGEIRHNGSLYEIRFAGAGVHRISEVDQTAFPPDGDPILVPPAAPPPSTSRVPTRVDNGSTIDVLLLYTPAAKTAAGGTAAVQALIDLAIANTNTSYANSGVIQRMNVVSKQEIAYTEFAPFGVNGFILDRAYLQGTSDGVIDQVHSIRDAFAADLVALIVGNGTQLCGIAYIMPANDTSGANTSAFSVNDQSCIAGNLTLAHEMGHNQSLQHDNQPGGTFDAYGRGYNDGTVRTVMAVSSAQSRRQNFSNPNTVFVDLQSVDPEGYRAIGDPSGTATRDAARTLNETRVSLANYRVSPTYTLTIAGTGTGTGTVTGTGINCTSTAGVASGDCAETASPGTVIALTGTALAGSSFTGFTGEPAGCTDGSITLGANTTCTAGFTLNPPPPPPPPAGFTITTTGAGTGTGTLTATGITCTSSAGVTSGDCAEGPVASGTVFAITATPSVGSTFANWVGCDSTAGTVCHLTLTADRTVTATLGGMSVPATGVQDTNQRKLDLDGSGRSATIVYDAVTGGAMVFRENGALTLPAILVGATTHTWSAGWTLKPGDFNGDGRTDLLFYNAVTGAVFKGISDGAFNFTFFATTWSAGWEIAVLNLNGDTLDDVLLYNTVTGQYFRGTGTGDGTSDFAYAAGVWSAGWLVVPMQLDADGLTDLFLYNSVTGQYYRAVNSGSGFTYTSGTISAGWQLTPGHYNADTLSDLFFYNVVTGAYFVGLNNGSVFTFTSGTFSPGWTVRAGDFSGDGITDVFLYNVVTGAYFVSVSNGVGGFTHFGGALSAGWQVFVTGFSPDVIADLVFYNATTGSYFQGITTTPGSFNFFGGTFGAGQTIITNRP